MAGDGIIGGICGQASGNISDCVIDKCYNSGKINVYSGKSVAGIIGYINYDGEGSVLFSITNCYNIGDTNST